MTTILLITIEFPPETGGIENYTYNLIKRIPNSIVLAPNVPNADKFDNKQDFKIIRKKILYHRQHWLFKNRFYANSIGYLITSIALIWHSWHIIKDEKPDLILCSDSIPVGIVIGLLYKINKIPYIVFSYAKDVLFLQQMPFMKTLLGITFTNSAKVIVISEFTRKLIMDLKTKKSNTSKINPCVDSNFFKPMNVSNLKEQYGLSDKKIILTVARLDEMKGNDMVLRSMPEVLKKTPNLMYLIAGNGQNKNQLEKLTSELNLDDHVRFVGYISDEELPIYYNLCDVFIMPSRNVKRDPEGFGIVYVEASACEKPVIGSRMGGIPDAVIDGVTGILVDPLNTKDISNAIIELLSNEKKAEEMGKAGRARAVEQLNWDTAAQKLRNVCDLVITDATEDRQYPETCPHDHLP